MNIQYRTSHAPWWALSTASVLATLLAVCAMMGNPVRISAGSYPTERDLKAACIYNFAKFVEFPSSAFSNANAPVVIGVFGDNQFANALKKMVDGKTANGRKLEVRRFRKARECDQCQVLFVSSSESTRVLDQLKGMSILTVGESNGFARRGGIIGFVVNNDKVGFEINLGVAKKSGLKISSKLLSLAKTVIG